MGQVINLDFKIHLFILPYLVSFTNAYYLDLKNERCARYQNEYIENPSMRLYEGVTLQDRLMDGSKKMFEDRFEVGAGTNTLAIFGMSGSGKSTLAQILAGNLSTVFGTKHTDGSYIFYDIPDEKKVTRIGAPGSPTKTILPEFVPSRENSITIIDCPPFSPNLSTDEDIAASYHLTRAIGLSSQLKFLLTITFDSIDPNNLESFDLSLVHMVTLLPNLLEISSSIGIVLTKTPRWSAAGAELTRQDILTTFLQSMNAYITTMKTLLAKRSHFSNLDLIEKCVTFVELLVSDVGVDLLPGRVSYVMDPLNQIDTALESIPEILETKESLTGLYTNVLDFAGIANHHFRILLEKEKIPLMKMTIPSIIYGIGIDTRLGMKQAVQQFMKRFYKDFGLDKDEDTYRQATDYIYDWDDRDNGYDYSDYNRDYVASHISEQYRKHPRDQYRRESINLDSSQRNVSYAIREVLQKLGAHMIEMQCNKANFIEYLLKIFWILKMNPSDKQCAMFDISELVSQLNFLELHSGDFELQPDKAWLSALEDGITYLAEIHEFYSFCEHVEEELGTYKPQAFLSRMLATGNITDFDMGNIPEILEQLLEIPTTIKKIFNSTLENYDKQFLVAVFKSQIPNVKITCEATLPPSEKKRLKVVGRNVKFSDIFHELGLPLPNWPSDCLSASDWPNPFDAIEQISIFAQDTLYIDTDLVLENDKVHVCILAPEWQVHSANIMGLRFYSYDGKNWTGSLLSGFGARGVNLTEFAFVRFSSYHYQKWYGHTYRKPVKRLDGRLWVGYPWANQDIGKLINEYKGLYGSLHTKHDFMSDLDTIIPFLHMQTAFSMAEEIIQTELQYYRESNAAAVGDRFQWEKREAEHLRFYQNFCKKVKRYSSNLKTVEVDDEDFEIDYDVVEIAALNHLYIAALGKVVALRQNLLSSKKVIKTQEYFATLETQMELLKGSLALIDQVNEEVTENERRNKEVERIRKGIDAQKNKYNNELNSKILEANKCIDNIVMPAIDQSQVVLNELTGKLEAELGAILQSAKDHAAKVTAMRDKIKRQFHLKTFYSSLNLIGNVASMFGPIGAIAGAVINGVSGVAAGLTLEEVNIKDEQFPLPDGVTQTFVTRNKDYYDERRESFELQMQLIDNSIKTEKFRAFAQDNVSYRNLSSMDSLEVAIAEADIKRGEAETAFNDPKVDGMTKFQKHVDAEKANNDMKAEYAKKKKERTDKIFAKTEAAVKVANAGVSLYNTVKDGLNEIEEANQIVAKAEETVRAVQAKKDAVSTQFAPLLDKSINAIKEAGRKLNGTSQVGLSVKGWSFQQIVQSMEDAILDFTQGLQVQQEFLRCVKNLQQGIDLLIELYTHIERYEESKELADYIANVNGVQHEQRISEHTELSMIIPRVKFLMMANLFFYDYRLALSAFKQWAFPYANKYLQNDVTELQMEQLLPKGKNVTSSASLDGLTRYYISKVQFLSKSLGEYHATTTYGDTVIISTVFMSGLKTMRPFYVWDNEHYHKDIIDLFNFTKIHLHANIDDKSLEWMRTMTCVKYKCVRLKVRALNQTRQQELDDLLDYFQVEYTHSGISVYRAVGKKYVMFDSPQTYLYGYETFLDADGKEQAVTVSLVQEKVCKGSDHLMSPYTWWTIKFRPGFAVSDSMALAKSEELIFQFGNEVVLELEGGGVFLDEENVKPEVLMDLQLDSYYEPYNDHYFEGFEEHTHKSCGNDRQYANSHHYRASSSGCPVGGEWECFDNEWIRDQTCEDREWVKQWVQEFDVTCYCCQR